MDVLVRFDDLGQLNDQLLAIVAELDAAGSRSDQLESAIGRPYGRSELTDAVSSFESRWNDKRNDLATGTKGVQENVQAVIDGFSDWDTETAAGFDSSAA